MKMPYSSVLLIDDHDLSNFITQSVIISSKSFTHSIILPSAYSALQLLNDTQKNNTEIPDVILLDIDMPVMDGFCFLCEFDKLPESIRNKTKIIVLSGNDHREKLSPWIENRKVTHFLRKPLTVKLLNEALMSI